MTAQEFRDYYKALRNDLPYIRNDALEQLRVTYEQAAAKVAEIVRYAESKNLSELTSGTWRQIEHELLEEADKIREAIRAGAQYAVEASARRTAEIHQDYLSGIIDISDGKITQAGIINTFSSLDRKLITAMVNKHSGDGYTFSERVWNAGEDVMENIKNVVRVGVSIGRDGIEIAEDLEVYLKGGRQALAKRYGDLIKGTPEWSSRIRKNIDYRALRLVRSELYQSLQDASLLSAKMNPACLDLFDWIRNTSENWNCVCPEYARNSPYTLSTVPSYPHPNCLCLIRPRLRNSNDFISDLKRWVSGEDVSYIDDWYENYYSQAA